MQRSADIKFGGYQIHMPFKVVRGRKFANGIKCLAMDFPELLNRNSYDMSNLQDQVISTSLDTFFGKLSEAKFLSVSSFEFSCH